MELPVIPAKCRRLRQEDSKFIGSLGYITKKKITILDVLIGCVAVPSFSHRVPHQHPGTVRGHVPFEIASSQMAIAGVYSSDIYLLNFK